MAPSPAITPANQLFTRQNGNAPPGGSLATQLNTPTIIGLSVAGGTLLILVICSTIVWVKRKRRKQKASTRDRLECRKIGDPIPIDSTSTDLQRPNFHQPSTESFNSTLSDIKFDPCVAASHIYL